MPGFGGPMAAQQPQAPGFLARWFGGAAPAPPIVPGQFAHGPGFFNPQQGAFNHQAQQGVLVQNPFGPWQQPGYYVPVQQPPGPVQVLQGFYIGNQWQPWGLHPPPPRPHLRTQAQVPTQAPGVMPPTQPQPPSAQAGPDRESIPHRPAPPSRTTSSSQVSISSPNTPVTGESNGSVIGNTPEPSTSDAVRPTSNPSPREVAGLAALHRLNSRNVLPSPSPHTATTLPDAVPGPRNGQSEWNGSTSPRLPSPATGDPIANSTASSRGPSSVPQNVSAAMPTPRSSSATPTGAGSRTARTPVPALIPLFDPATTSATIVAPPPYYRAPHVSPSQYQSPPNAYPSAYNPQQRPRPRVGADSHPLVSELLRNSGNLPDLRSLPQTLTEEQLNRLDAVTREAIDERLRALEHVQGTLWRCVEELVRVRSVLPNRREGAPTSEAPDSSQSDSSDSSHSESSQSQESSSGKVSETFDDKGKAKIPAAAEDAQEANSSPTAATADLVAPGDLGADLPAKTPALVAGEAVPEPTQ